MQSKRGGGAVVGKRDEGGGAVGSGRVALGLVGGALGVGVKSVRRGRWCSVC